MSVPTLPILEGIISHSKELRLSTRLSFPQSLSQEYDSIAIHLDGMPSDIHMTKTNFG